MADGGHRESEVARPRWTAWYESIEMAEGGHRESEVEEVPGRGGRPGMRVLEWRKVARTRFREEEGSRRAIEQVLSLRRRE